MENNKPPTSNISESSSNSQLPYNFKYLTLVINNSPLIYINSESQTTTQNDLSLNSINEIDNINEEWRSLSLLGYPNYEISSYGRVKNILHKQYIKSRYTNDGYKKITLSNGKMKSFLVHQLVAKIFFPQTNYTGLTVDHINRKRDDNHISNLRWADKDIQTQTQNRVVVSGGNIRSIKQYDLNGNFLTEWKSLKEAGNSGFGCRSIIQQICDGYRESFNGYVWRYSDQELLQGEIWRPISYESCKEVFVSNKGRVMLNRNRITAGSSSSGYHRVTIKSLDMGRPKQIYLHRLVMAAFKGENPEMEIYLIII
jgi:hypothetical protein